MTKFHSRRFCLGSIAGLLTVGFGLANAQQPGHDHAHDHTSVLSVRAMQDALCSPGNLEDSWRGSRSAGLQRADADHHSEEQRLPVAPHDLGRGGACQDSASTPGHRAWQL